jgi:(p)ppGpp synthase/HD superfamily hydrolase
MLVVKAISYAAKMHAGQVRRESGLPYVIHPMTVMELIHKFKYDSSNIESLKCAALLHDVLEDTDCTYVDIEREFSPMIASMVMELTSDDVKIKEVGKNEYLKIKMVDMSKYAYLLKLVDRLSNVMDNPTEKYVSNTIELMEHLDKNRKGITGTQRRVMTNILQVCGYYGK